MEKMQLGSPASPGVQNAYLPNFLMGVDNNQTPNRNSFSNSPTASPDFNRNPQHKFFTGLQSPGSVNNSSMNHQNAQQQHQQQQFYQAQNPNASISGPPTTGLFDYLKNDKSFQTPTKNFMSQQQSQSFSNGNQQQQSFMNQSGFNQSRVLSPISHLASNNDFSNSYQQQQNSSAVQTTIPASNSGFNNNFWITIFGFPQSAVSAILSHFSQCGSILEKICSSGNWIHLRFSSRLESDKALLYNGKIICNNLMVGVMRCTDEAILEKENEGLQQRDINVSRIRSLTQAAYKSAQEPTEVILSPNAPKRTTGIINKTLDMFFGW